MFTLRCPINVRYVSDMSDIQTSLSSFLMSGSHTRTTLKTARKTITANPHTSILYQKKYKMPYPIFAVILLPLPTHAQQSNPATHSNIRYLYDYKPLLTVEPAEPAAQGIILIKTANAVITFFSTIHLTDKKWILTGKQGFVKANPNRKKTVNGKKNTAKFE